MVISVVYMVVVVGIVVAAVVVVVMAVVVMVMANVMAMAMGLITATVRTAAHHCQVRQLTNHQHSCLSLPVVRT